MQDWKTAHGWKNDMIRRNWTRRCWARSSWRFFARSWHFFRSV